MPEKMDPKGRDRRDNFLNKLRTSGDGVTWRQMRAEYMDNGDVLEWYVVTAPKVYRAFIIQIYANGNGIEVYPAAQGVRVDTAVVELLNPLHTDAKDVKAPS